MIDKNKLRTDDFNRLSDSLNNAVNVITRAVMEPLSDILDKIVALLEDEWYRPCQLLAENQYVMHFVLTTTNHVTKDRTLDEGAYALADLLHSMGYQFVMVPHRASTTNPEHYHWHVVVNVKSYTTGKTLLDKYSTYGMILNHLNNNPYTKWGWMYRYDTDPKFLSEI